MRSFLINKNLSLYYLLQKRIGKTAAFKVTNAIEKIILIFGRERMPYGRIKIHNKVKQLELMFSIKKSILIYKLMNYIDLIK
jgi:rRNA processing protein Gar1